MGRKLAYARERKRERELLRTTIHFDYRRSVEITRGTLRVIEMVGRIIEANGYVAGSPIVDSECLFRETNADRR